MRKIVRGAATATTMTAILLAAAACQPQQQPGTQQQQQGRLNDGSAALANSNVRPSALDVTGTGNSGTPMYRPAAFHPAQAVIPPEEPAISATPVLDAQPAAPAKANHAKVALATKSHSKPAIASVKAQPSVAAAGNSYKVKKGDTLFAIARAHYGDGKQWQRIAAANPGVSPASLRVGQTLALPQ